MTAVTAAAPQPGAFARSWRIVRLLTANPTTTIAWPIAILGAIFVMSWAIWWIIFANLEPEARMNASDGIQFSGAAFYIFVYMLVVSVQAVNFAFPLALGFGSTRRAFTTGAALTFVLLSLGYATLMLVGSVLEVVTDGWGLNGSFFRTAYFETELGWIAQWWVYFCWFVFFFFVGMIFAAVYVRWKAFGLITTFLVLGVLLVGGIGLLTFTDTWPDFWVALIDLGVLGIANSMILIGIASAFASHLILRRATPRN